MRGGREDRRQEEQVGGLRLQDVRPRLDRFFVEAPGIGRRLRQSFTDDGFRKNFAIVRTLSRTARVPLAMLMDARDTACTSSPTRNGARTL